MSKHEIHIGKVYNIELGTYVPKRKIIISDDQKNIIEMFANKRINEGGLPLYNINGCDFEIYFHFDDKPYYREKPKEI